MQTVEGKEDRMMRPLEENKSQGLYSSLSACSLRLKGKFFCRRMKIIATKENTCIFMQMHNLHRFALSKVLGVAHLPGSATASPEQLSSYTTLVWKESFKWVQTSALSLAMPPEHYKLAFV